ncbi:limonene-1,2-epoxide hydrolase family protein [Kutzneria sp. NPDC052558]|uniref:limonene-1,2-epoxide hydrolase family protein n=1 Tax=Kutzneria sp. NPDC052558 TaxID=3364121 RepID=UPI0037C56A3A
MTRTPDELVAEFCALWASPDPEKLAEFFAEDAVYHNIPLSPVHGRAAIEEFIAGFTAGYDGIDFAVHHQVSYGNVVMNERTDTLRRKDGVAVDLPVAGVFEIVDDRIVAWRDYFDLATFTKAMG